MASKSSNGDDQQQEQPKDQASIITTQQTTFWDTMWQNEPFPRFDVRCPSPCLLQYIERHTIPPHGRALVPGCGRGYDLVALASPPERTEVIGLDLSPTGVQAARAYITDATHSDETIKGKIRVEAADFFSFVDEEGGFDVIYDYTFLCAIPPELRAEWAKKMASLVKKNNNKKKGHSKEEEEEEEGKGGGILMTLIFPICDKEGGPPYKVSLQVLKDLLEPVGFQAEKLELLPKELCHPGRDGTTEPWKAMSGVGLWRLVV